jgi:hypothetical protein
MASFIGGIVQLSLGVIFLATVFINQVKTTNTTGWTTTETTLWGLLTIAGIVGMVLGVLNLFGVV